MYSIHLSCSRTELDLLLAELWEAGTLGVQEMDSGERVRLIAAFPREIPSAELLLRFRNYRPELHEGEDRDWVKYVRDSWPGRPIGTSLFLVPPWSEEVPTGRIRIVQNPGLASGTGEHPCTQLALMALERFVAGGDFVVDVGTGSGILAIAAVRLGARAAIGIDTDETGFQTAQENYRLNSVPATLAVGTTDCVATGAADLTVTNINASVLLSIADELLRITTAGGRLILTGFEDSELPRLQELFGNGEVSAIDEWRCLTLTA